MPHFLRLKEQKRNRIAPAHPTALQLKRSDGSLEDTAFDMTTDENGFIITGSDVDASKPSIFFVGGSLVESSFAHPQDRFVAQIAKKVEWNVFNAGYSGTTLLQSCLMIIGKFPMIAKKGDAVVLFASQSDANAARSKGGYWTNNSTYSPLKPPIPKTPAFDFSFSDTVDLLSTIELFLNRRGIHLVVVSAPYRNIDWTSDKWVRGNYGKEEVYKKARALREGLNETVATFGSESGRKFLDLAAVMNGEPDHFYDEQHFNKKGHDRAAEVLTGFLQQELLNARI